MTDFSHDSDTTAFDLDRLGLVGDAHIYPPTVELFSQGAQPADVYFIHSGIMKLTRSEDNGQEILLDLRFGGSLVGSAAAIRQKPHPFAAVTITRCVLTRWSCGQFLSLLAANANLAARVREILSDEVLDHVTRLSQLACLPARQRLEQLLWQFCKRLSRNSYSSQHEKTSKLELPLKHYEIAHLLSITPTYLCRLLNVLERENVIRRSKGWIVIMKPSELWHDLPEPTTLDSFEVDPRAVR
jgi:CRP/FNR family transcriptional regulator